MDFVTDLITGLNIAIWVRVCIKPVRVLGCMEFDHRACTTDQDTGSDPGMCVQGHAQNISDKHQNSYAEASITPITIGEDQAFLD